MSLLDYLDDTMITEVASFAPSPLNAPWRAICVRMRRVVPRPQTRTALELLAYGASINACEICRLARDKGARYCRKKHEMAYIGAKMGHLHVCELAYSWARMGLIDRNDDARNFIVWLLIGAAEGAQCEINDIAHKWLSEINDILAMHGLYDLDIPWTTILAAGMRALRTTRV